MSEENLKTDLAGWEQEPDELLPNLKSVLPTKGREEAYKSVTKDLGPVLKSLLSASAETLEDIDKVLSTDPAAKKSFDDMIKGKQDHLDMEQAMGRVSNIVSSMMIDPDLLYDRVENYNFPRNRVSPRLLRRAGASVTIRMIKQFRNYQIAEFSKVSDGKNEGFKLKFIDPDRKATPKEMETIKKYEQIFATQFFYVPMEEKPSLFKFMTYMFQDFFDLDKVAIEIVRQRASTNKKYDYRGIPLGFQLVDAATIYHIVPEEKVSRDKINQYRYDNDDYKKTLSDAGLAPEYRDEFRYVQVDRRHIKRAAYTEENMILSHAFGTTDIREQFQGFSIVEQGLDMIRYIIDSVVYNYTRRSTGTMPKGMIVVEGATEDGYSRKEMELFRKLIWGIASGHKDKWKYPILGTPKGVKPQFIKFHESSREMEDFLWMSTLFSIVCALSGLNPEDISLASQKNTLGKSKMFQQEEKGGAQYRSQDEGFRFFLGYVAEIINQSKAVPEMTGIDGLAWTWYGLDIEDEAKKKELEKLSLETTSSVNDLLKAQDKPTATLMIGDQNLYDLPGIGNTTIMQGIILGLGGVPEEGGMELEETDDDKGMTKSQTKIIVIDE